MRHVLPLILCAACTGRAVCDLPARGKLTGEVDGERWTTGGVVWNETGDGIQITTDSGDGYRVTFSLQEDADGIALTEVIESGPVPTEVSFDDGNTAFALIYPEGESSSLSTKGSVGGWLSIEEVSDGVVGACFSFEASSADRSAVVGGGLRAPRM